MKFWQVLAAVMAITSAAMAQGEHRLEAATQDFLDVLAQQEPDASFAQFSARLRGIVPQPDWQVMRDGQTANFGALGPLKAHKFDHREGDNLRVFVSFSGTYGSGPDPVCGLIIWEENNGAEPEVGGIYLNFLPMDRVSLMPRTQLAQLEQKARCPAGLLSPPG